MTTMYNNRYKFINFIPDPFLDTTLTIGAIIQNGNNVVVFITEKLPTKDYVGEATSALLKVLVDKIKATDWVSVNQRPEEYGPRIVYSILRDVPLSATDSVKWVKELFKVEDNG